MSKNVDCALTASFLDSGRTMANAANAAAVIAGLGCVMVEPSGSRIALAASILLWLAQCYFAVRVLIDASLFRVLAGDLEEGTRRLDEVLNRPNRTVEDRLRGALGLWRGQIVTFVLQLAALAAGAVLRLANV